MSSYVEFEKRHKGRNLSILLALQKMLIPESYNILQIKYIFYFLVPGKKSRENLKNCVKSCKNHVKLRINHVKSRKIV